MTISFIIPCYNAAPWLDETLASIVAQTRPDWEVVIVDDGSTDDSAAVARRWTEREPRIRLLLQPNSGVSAARNLALREAKGEFLTFLDADDTLGPHFIEVMLGALERAPELLGAACEHIVMQTDGSRPVQPLPGSGERLVIDDILPHNGWAPHAAVVRRELIDRIGGFDPEMVGAEDWDVWLRATAVSDFVAVRRPLAFYRRHEKQASNNFMTMAAHAGHVLDSFERKHPEIIERYGRARHRENGARLILVYADKSLKTGWKQVALNLTLMAWRRAPLSIAVMSRIARMWLTAPFTGFPAWAQK